MRRVDYVDPETGEIFKGTMVLYKHVEKIGGWCMSFQESLLSIAKDREITGEVHRVLDVLVANVEYGNNVNISQGWIAEFLGMRQSHVSRSIGVLLRKGILLERENLSRSKIYSLNPDFVWKGSARQLKEVRKEKTKKCIDGINNHG